MYANVQSKASDVKSVRPERNMGPLLPFEELVNETELGDESCEQEEDCRNDSLEDCNLPDPCALLNITNRRKVPLKKQSSSVVRILPLLAHLYISLLWTLTCFKLPGGQWTNGSASWIWGFAFKIWISGKSFYFCFCFYKTLIHHWPSYICDHTSSCRGL